MKAFLTITINPDEYRWEGEKKSLYIGFIILAICFLFSAALSFGVAVFIIIVVALFVWTTQGQQIGSMVKVDLNQFPEVYSLSIVAGRRLTMSPQRVYIKYNPVINAYALGFLREKNVVLHSATVEAMTAKELQFIIGHEFSHIKCGHTDLIVLTQPQGQLLGWLSGILRLFFNTWSRRAEYTCDRAGLLSCRDLDAAIGAMCKMAIGPELFARMNIGKFLEQLRELEGDEVSKLSELFTDHPYLIRRAKALRDFWNSGLYKRLASRVD